MASSNNRGARNMGVLVFSVVMDDGCARESEALSAVPQYHVDQC